MDDLVDLVAPRRAWDFILRAIGIVIFVNSFNVFVNIWIKGLDSVPPVEFVIATTVSLPFVILALALLQRQRHMQARLARLAMTDVLTGLPNRRGFEAAAADQKVSAVLVADIDNFKRVNDSYGHAAGDSSLRQVAERIRTTLRPGEFAARLGGEEFGIVITAKAAGGPLTGGSGRAAAQKRLETIAARLVHPFAIDLGRDDIALELTLSCGVAFAKGSSKICELVADADRALYRAKARGRAQMVLDGDAETAQPAASAIAV
ncbi:GGDEF domain-containing protein [Pseudoroseicyclus sp. CXY001]|uniref:GGDEF domain-containing protein n=1 Tax=Pseudoroseicyclus sp. CXY001 TaxID=3242492 RepID=UPI003570D010